MAPLDALAPVLLSVREARPVVQMAFLLRFLCGAVLAWAWDGARFTVGLAGTIVAAATVWECAVVFVYLLNGVTDRTEDAANSTGRPVAAGVLPARTAAAHAVACAVAAVSGAVLLSGALLISVLGMLGLGYAYSGPPILGKRYPASAFAITAAGGLLTYQAGVLAAGGSEPPPPVVVLGFFMALWMGLIGTVTKDLSDVVGDVRAGRSSVAIRLGARRARGLVAVLAPLLGAGLLASAVVFADRRSSSPATAGLLAGGIVLLVGALVLAFRALTEPDGSTRRQLRGLYRVFMAVQYLVHFAVLAATFVWARGA